MRITRLCNNVVTSELDKAKLEEVIAGIIENCERRLIVPQINEVLQKKGIRKIENIPELLGRFFGIDYCEVKSAIKLRGKLLSLGQNNHNDLKLSKYERLLLEEYPEICYNKKQLLGAVRYHFFSLGLSRQAIRKLLLLVPGDSGNDVMREEIRADRAHNRSTPPPMNKKMIEKVTICAGIFENELKKLGLGFDCLSDELKLGFWGHVEDPTRLKKSEASEIVESYLSNTETKIKIIEIALKKCFIEVLKDLSGYVTVNKKEKVKIINKFDNYVSSISDKTKLGFKKDDMRKVVINFIQNLNQPS